MKIDKFNSFIIEKSSSDIEIKYIGEIAPDSLIRNFIEIGMEEDDVILFGKYNDKVSFFKLKIPHVFQMDIDALLSDHVRSIEGLSVNHDKIFGLYWINMGNGLKSIAIEEDEGYNLSTYKIYSGDDDLTDFLKNELEDILAANKYNL